MAKKKSFSIGNSLSQALTDTVVAAKNYSGELHVEIIPLRKIELDPDNPRDLALSFSDLYEGLIQEDQHYERKNKEIDSLKSMVLSIKDQGVINPIVVYKHDEKYRLIAGERRTLASIIASKEDIPAKILTTKPSPLKLSVLQWAENIEREDLSLWERIRNLEKILCAYQATHNKSQKSISATELSSLIGCSLQQAVNYTNILSASPELMSVIQDNQIKNIEKAALIAKAPVSLQQHLIDKCVKGATLKSLKQLIKTLDKKQSLPAVKEKRGRQLTKIDFGATNKFNVAKIIIESALKNKKLSHLDAELGVIVWEDYKSVTAAFKLLIKKLENLSTKEVV